MVNQFSTALNMANSGFAVKLTEEIANYMMAKFLHKPKGSEDSPPFPPDWDFSLVQECDQAVSVLLEAYHNPCRLS